MKGYTNQGRLTSNSPNLKIRRDPVETRDRHDAHLAIRWFPKMKEWVHFLAETSTTLASEPEAIEPTPPGKLVTDPLAFRGPVVVPATEIPSARPQIPTLSLIPNSPQVRHPLPIPPPAPTISTPEPSKTRRRRNRQRRRRRSTRALAPPNASISSSLDLPRGLPQRCTAIRRDFEPEKNSRHDPFPPLESPGPHRPPARMAGLMDHPYPRPSDFLTVKTPAPAPVSPSLRTPPATRPSYCACDPIHTDCFACGWRGYTARNCPIHRNTWEQAYVAQQLSRQTPDDETVAAESALALPSRLTPPPTQTPQNPDLALVTAVIEVLRRLR